MELEQANMGMQVGVTSASKAGDVGDDIHGLDSTYERAGLVSCTA